MKNTLFLLAAVALLSGCAADKSDAVQTNQAPSGGKAYSAGSAASTNPSVPAAVKGAAPGLGK